MKITRKNNRLGARKNARRGTAAIECMIAIPILLGVMWLVKGSFELGVARLQNSFHAEEMAYADATTPVASPADSDTGYLDPTVGFTTALPQLGVDLPNRMHVSQAKTTVNYTMNVPLPTANLQDFAAFAAPTWTYNAWPTGDANGFSDASTMADWFSAYTAEVRTPTIEDSLELSPSSPP